MDIGKIYFKSDNVGMFLYVLVQTIVCALACSKVITILEELKLRKTIVYLMLMIYAFFPDFGAAAQHGTKDVLNYGLILLSGAYLFQIYRQVLKKEFAGKTFLSCIGYINFSFLSCLYRKEMCYIYIVTTSLLFLYAFRNKAKNICIVLLYGIFIFCSSSAFSEKIIAEKFMNRTFNGGAAESLSIPLLQVARFVYFHNNLVTDEEKEILNRSFVDGYDGILKNYNPNLSDKIKGRFRVKEAPKSGFYKVYWSFFKKDPILFAESLIAGSYGYYTLHPNAPKTINKAPTNGLPGSRLPQLFIHNGPDKKLGYISGIKYREETKGLRTLLADWIQESEKTFNVIFGFGFSTFLMIILASYAVQKTKTIAVLIPFALPIMLCFVCIASPVNDYGRYYMGIFYLMPLLIGITIKTSKQNC